MKFYKINLSKKEAAKFAKKKQIVLGGRLTDDGKNIVIAIRKGANKVLKVIEVVDDIFGEIIEKGTPLWHKITDFFEHIFNMLPVEIDYNDNVFRLTLQPAMGKEIDNVFYLSESITNPKVKKPKDGNVLFMQKARTKGQAKHQMRLHLKKISFIH